MNKEENTAITEDSLKIAAYPRHLAKIEELEKENIELKEAKQIAWEQFQYSQKELHDTTLELKHLENQWNKVIQEVEKLMVPGGTWNKELKYILSILKTEIKEVK